MQENVTEHTLVILVNSKLLIAGRHIDGARTPKQMQVK
jgi:hypothetical protein